MPLFSLFLLGLYVFLQSAPTFDWFTVDPKFTAFIGLAFVIVLVVELVFYWRGHPNFWKRPS